MVVVRIVVLLAWGCVVPAAWCLSLPPNPHQPHQEPLTPSHLGNIIPQDDSNLPLDSLDESQLLRELEGSSYPYRLQEAIAEEALNGEASSDLPTDAEVAAAAAAVMAAAGGRREGGAWVDPRYYVLDDFLTRPDGGSSSENSKVGGMIRKARNSRDSSTSSSTDSSSKNSNSKNSNMKRGWPHGFSRRRSGLSLSIDASMKVLREALYLEIARKKQRQQLQRAQQNKAILNHIGKRDVSAQLNSFHRHNPTLVHRN